jgi:hypothetical protein
MMFQQQVLNIVDYVDYEENDRWQTEKNLKESCQDSPSQKSVN